MSAFTSGFIAFVLFCATGVGGWWWPAGEDEADPVVSFVQPSASTTFERPLSYGAIQVEASDPDAGRRNGDGIHRVEMEITDVATGEVVAARSEYWPTYDFGPDLPDGTYELVATAHATRWAGGTSSNASIVITIETTPTTPSTTVPSTTASTTTSTSTTAPPSTTTSTTAAPSTTTSTTAAPSTTTSTTAAPTTAAPTTTAPPTTAAPASDIDRANARSLELLNELRSQQGLGQLQSDQAMATFATDWSATMSRSGFRHSDGPYAENIVWYSDDSMTPEQAAEQFHQSWVNSPGHYANMTNPRWTLVGVGLHRDESGWWGTHVFR